MDMQIRLKTNVFNWKTIRYHKRVEKIHRKTAECRKKRNLPRQEIVALYSTDLEAA